MTTTKHRSLLDGLDEFVTEQLQTWKGLAQRSL